LDYLSVCETIERLAESQTSTLGADVRTLMAHYTQMLRRHIVPESEIADLCRRIYRKHRRALDLVYEYIPDQQGVIREILEEAVRDSRGLDLDYGGKSYIRFVPKAWDVPTLRGGEGW